jgi:hypothetical protein
MTASRFFYHSFPRRAADEGYSRALSILESVLKRGLLLVPERIEFQEELADGSFSAPWHIMQKRICFTELHPQELAGHAERFGSFALEWEITTLIEMGAIPCFYVPLRASANSNDGVASAMLARLGEAQELLVRLEKLDALIRQSTDKDELLNVTRNGEAVGATQCTVAAARDLLQAVQMGIQPISALTAALRVLAGYFYPTDHPTYTDLLGYYRQREWKVLANMNNGGTPVTVQVDDHESAELLAVDNEFFGRELDFPTGRKARVSGCQLYKTFRGAPVINSVRRLVCPKGAVSDVVRLLESHGVNLEVAAIEDLSAA